MKFSKTTSFILLASAFFIVGGWFVLRDRDNDRDNINAPKLEVVKPEPEVTNRYPFSITIDGIDLNVAVAETADEMARGFSGRTGLAEDEGMLFVYDTPGFYSFWMKEMLFPIDILWIGEDFQVVDITKNFKPESFPQTVKPQKPVQYVVEVNAGWVEEHRIHIGSPVLFNDIKIEISGIADAVQEIISSENVLLDVPFTPQAPFGNWDDVRQQNGCEEAAILMAIRWARGESLTFEEAEREILAISDYEKEKYGHFHDTSAQDTAKLLKDYFGYNGVAMRYNISNEDIKKELAQGNLVIVPVNGQKLGNPYYTPPGPIEHMLVIRGFDDTVQEFIVNDPGTKRGEANRYDYQILENALRDYSSGYHEPITGIQTAMIVVEK